MRKEAGMAQRARLGVAYKAKAVVMWDGVTPETPQHIQDAAKAKAEAKRERKNARRLQLQGSRE